MQLHAKQLRVELGEIRIERVRRVVVRTAAIGDPELEARVTAMMARSSAGILEEQVTSLQRSAGALSFMRRYGLPEYAELVTLGAP